MNVVAHAQLIYQMLTLLKKYINRQRLCSKHGRANVWPWYLNRLEHSAWIRRLWVRVPLRSRHFLSQKLWHFHKNTRSCVENEFCCPGTVNISNVNFTLKKNNIQMQKKLHNESEHVEAETQLPPFCRRRFPINFLEWKLWYFDSNLTEICSGGFNRQ